jgi:hypothetical protein
VRGRARGGSTEDAMRAAAAVLCGAGCGGGVCAAGRLATSEAAAPCGVLQRTVSGEARVPTNGRPWRAQHGASRPSVGVGAS